MRWPASAKNVLTLATVGTVSCGIGRMLNLSRLQYQSLGAQALLRHNLSHVTNRQTLFLPARPCLPCATVGRPPAALGTLALGVWYKVPPAAFGTLALGAWYKYQVPALVQSTKYRRWYKVPSTGAWDFAAPGKSRGACAAGESAPPPPIRARRRAAARPLTAGC